MVPWGTGFKGETVEDDWSRQVAATPEGDPPADGEASAFDPGLISV